MLDALAYVQREQAAGAVLHIDLDAIGSNYALLRARAGHAECGAVLKADAYGVGANRVAPILVQEGCRQFFVAHVGEGVALKALLPADATVYVLHGAPPGAESAVIEHNLVPVLNSLQQIKAWREQAVALQRRLPTVIQFDTGMSRMGLSPREIDILFVDQQWLAAFDLKMIMSHLACADDPEHPLNTLQLKRFKTIKAMFPNVRASLANSSGIFLGSDYHFDVVRPGAALYGIEPTTGKGNPLHQPLSLYAKVVQCRTIVAGDYVGYGGQYRAADTRRIATVSIGYADGLHRALSNRGTVFIDGSPVPILGRVSMDSITIDITDIDSETVFAGSYVEILGKSQGLDQLAKSAGTIGYEMLTSIGTRYHRQYL